MPEVNPQVGDFMDIGDQKKIGMAVGVYRDAGGSAWPTGEIAKFGGAVGADLKDERGFLPELQAVGNRCAGHMAGKESGEVGWLHAPKMAIKTKRL